MCTKLGAIWRIWLKFSMMIGTVQMLVLLTLVYWLAVPFIGLPVRFFKDPLKLKRPESTWVARSPTPVTRELMGNQF
jgi:hypothetical protein